MLRGLVLFVLFVQAVDPPKIEDSEVQRLVTALDAEARIDREQAEKELLSLGPEVLKWLPPLDDPNLSAEQRQRLRRLVPSLWEAKLKGDVAGSEVELSQPLPFGDAIEKLGQQSGNDLADMRPELGHEVTNPQVQLGAGKQRFWRALDEILEQSGTSLYFHSQDRKLGILGRPVRWGPIAYAGALRLEATRIVLERYLSETGEPASCILQIEGAIEPRLRPLLLEIDTTQCTARDDRGESLGFLGPERFPIMIDPDSFQFPLSIRMDVPSREAKAIAEISGEIIVSLPTSLETIELPALAASERTTPALRVRIGTVADDEGIWTVPIEVSQLLSAPASESYLDAGMQNELYLLDKEGDRVEANGGMNVIPSDDGVWRAEYLFVDLPGSPEDYRVVLKAPAGISKVPVPFQLKDIPLP